MQRCRAHGRTVTGKQGCPTVSAPHQPRQPATLASGLRPIPCPTHCKTRRTPRALPNSSRRMFGKSRVARGKQPPAPSAAARRLQMSHLGKKIQICGGLNYCPHQLHLQTRPLRKREPYPSPRAAERPGAAERLDVAAAVYTTLPTERFGKEGNVCTKYTLSICTCYLGFG